LKNENDIKIKITAGKTNENENYYKRKKRKIWANHTAILCQPAMAQQCEHNLAASSWTEK